MLRSLAPAGRCRKKLKSAGSRKRERQLRAIDTHIFGMLRGEMQLYVTQTIDVLQTLCGGGSELNVGSAQILISHAHVLRHSGSFKARTLQQAATGASIACTMYSQPRQRRRCLFPLLPACMSLKRIRVAPRREPKLGWMNSNEPWGTCTAEVELIRQDL